MSKDFDNTNRGSIWGNKKKEKDTHPDYTGTLNVNGVEFWVSAWKRKEGASPNSPSLSFSIKPKEDSRQDERRPVAKDQPRRSTREELDDEIPF